MCLLFYVDILADMNIYIDEIILGPKYNDAPWKIPYLQAKLEEMTQKIGFKNIISLSYSAIEYR